jgi:hypothetical protein
MSRPGHRHRWVLRVVFVLVVLVLGAAACSDSDGGDDPAAAEAGGSGTDGTTEAAQDTVEDENGTSEAGADEGDDGSSQSEAASSDEADAEEAAAGPLPEGEASSELVVLQEDPYVAAAVYPRPDYEGNPWSVWGQGLLADNGRLLTAMGDHLGQDGNTYLYAYDHDEGRLTLFADVQSIVGHEPGSWGYGKVHGQFSDVGDGSVYFATYYGSRDDITFDENYQGDVLARLDPDSLEAEKIAVPVPEYGIPSLTGSPLGLLYGEAVDPMLGDGEYPGGGLFVFDPESNEVVLFEENVEHDMFRNVIVDADGGAWFAADGGGLFHYSPDDNEVTRSDVDLGGRLRASTRPDADGTVYGVTDDPYNIFAFQPGGSVTQLGHAPDYTTSVALSPDESAVLYVPGAHGDAPLWNTPLVSVDTETGDQTTLVELLPLVEEEFGLALGGTYSIVVDGERDLAYITFNAGTTTEDPWGEAVLVVVGL